VKESRDIAERCDVQPQTNKPVGIDLDAQFDDLIRRLEACEPTNDISDAETAAEVRAVRVLNSMRRG
jgi:hypothetical protein